jgi:hypothetical protein
MSTTSSESQAQRIFQHALRSATPFCSRDGQACISVPVGIDTHEVWPIDSPLFRDWLADGFYREQGQFPGRNQLRDAVRMLAAQARHSDFPAQAVDLRVSYRGDRLAPRAILLDLTNQAGEAVEIKPGGWEVQGGRHFFRRVRNMEALPAPDSSGSADWPIARDPKLFAWLMAALRPAGPYPMLLLKGSSGSGKSTAARMLRALIDPSTSLFCQQPSTETELRSLAWNNRVLAFDHVAALPARIAAGLRRLSSGDSVALRGETGEALAANLQRPVILTLPAEESWRARAADADLWNNAIVAELPPIDPDRRCTETHLWRAFEDARAGLLAKICDGVGAAMRYFDRTSLESNPTFADAAAWAVAAAPALGIAESAMRAAVSPDPIAIAVARLVREEG